MSRIGKKPIAIPKGVTLKVSSERVEVKGPKGTLETVVPSGITVREEGENLLVERDHDDKTHRARHGMVRSLISNNVVGVTNGWKKDLEIVGIGYRAALEGDGNVAFNLGYSHVKNYPVPDGIQIAVEKQTKLSVAGIDKQQVGQVAAEIRALRPPEPYKGKGIRYADETIKRKVGKTGA